MESLPVNGGEGTEFSDEIGCTTEKLSVVVNEGEIEFSDDVERMEAILWIKGGEADEISNEVFGVRCDGGRLSVEGEGDEFFNSLVAISKSFLLYCIDQLALLICLLDAMQNEMQAKIMGRSILPYASPEKSFSPECS